MPAPLPLHRIFASWWPLAGSWALMALEGPAQAAIIARLAEPKINLAAYGGVVFPLALIIESPIIMLLAASTALSKDRKSFLRVRRFMMSAGAITTVVHFLVAFTPLYDLLVRNIIGAPAEIIDPARIGLRIMLPWSWSIAYRRFHQGVLIRFGHSRVVGQGTLVRLSANLIVLFTGLWLGRIPGIVIATAAVATGVVSEAIYVGFLVRPVLQSELQHAPAIDPPLTWRAFASFYIPLALTSLLWLLVNPLGSAALSRMPHALESLAVWSVVVGITFLVRSLGIAFNEVVVALLDEPGSSLSLQRFTKLLAFATTALLLLIAVTPLSTWYFRVVSALPADLVELSRRGLLLALPLPALNTLQSWYQGAILHGRKTRGVTESVIVFLITSLTILSIGVACGQVTGLYVGMAAFTLSFLAQTAWLWGRSRFILRMIWQRDTAALLT